MTTLAPVWASSLAIARPIPRPAPVTIAVFPSSRFSIWPSFASCAACCSSFPHIFDNRFPADHQHSCLIRAVSSQCKQAFLFTHANDLDAGRHRIADVDGGEKLQRLA